MNLADKREKYLCKASYVTLDDIPTWKEYSRNIKRNRPNKALEYKKDVRLNDKVSIFVGDITNLEIDAIINSTNNRLLCAAIQKGDANESTKVIHKEIHRAAGSALFSECISLNGCEKGEARITGGYNLPAKYIIHTAGPVGWKPVLLRNCYLSCLNLAKENGLKTVAFPCISTGHCGYPNRDAAQVALRTSREFLEEDVTEMDRIIFCLFQSIDVRVYESLMHNYFPV
ncbi:unnamed protein product [Larinioides sclopetarius]